MVPKRLLQQGGAYYSAQDGDPGSEEHAQTPLGPRADLGQSLAQLTAQRDDLLGGVLAHRGELGVHVLPQLAAVSGITLKVSDVKGAWTVILGWVRSEEGGWIDLMDFARWGFP